MADMLSRCNGYGNQHSISASVQKLFELAEMGNDTPDLYDTVLTNDRAYCVDNGEPSLFRLFVGWVPKVFTEADLLPLFEQCGAVKDLIVLKDKVTGQPRGCAFVSFSSKEEAEAAIQKLDRKVQLPGALNPLEVRFARSHQYVQAGAGPEDNRQLFFARAPVLASEEQIRAMFEKFGPVEEVNLFRERRTHVSKGCGFVTMMHRDSAMEALEALDDKCTPEHATSQPLAVKWADPELQLKKRRAVEDTNAENRMLFFAKVLRNANEEDVRELFSKFGKIHDVNLFRAFQGAPTTKGCGLVTLGSHEAASAAINALDSKYVWEGMDAPMVVKWMDAALQKRRREEHLAAMRQGLVPSMGHMSAPALSLPGSTVGLGGPAMLSPLLKGKVDISEPPPAGCHPDAIKLFVGNIPKSYTEEQLRPFFGSAGNIIELVVVRDKFTHESKGSAFVWYQTRSQAERAIAQFNVRHCLPDPTGEQDRPLVVRRANQRKHNSGSHAGAGAGGAPPMHHGCLPQLPLMDVAAMAMAEMPVHLQHLMAMPQMGMAKQPHPYAKQLPSSDMNTLSWSLDSLSLSGDNNITSSSSLVFDGYGVQTLHPSGMSNSGMMSGRSGSTGAGSMLQQPSHQSHGHSLDAYINARPGLQVAAPMHADSMGHCTVTLQLTAPQMTAINNHMYSVQTMSGAQLRAAAGAHGLFFLIISGGEPQVESAQALVTAVLNNAPLM